MKKSKKAIAAATVFLAALNINACGYGPQEAYMVNPEPEVQQSVSEDAVSGDETGTRAPDKDGKTDAKLYENDSETDPQITEEDGNE